MNPRNITFYSESNPKAAKVANKKAKLKQLMSAGHTKKAAQRMVKEMRWMVAPFGLVQMRECEIVEYIK